MKRTLLALAIPLALSASAFAQQRLEQPKTPHDGIGVDYTQPWLNDLLLRLDTWNSATFVMRRPDLLQQVPECREEFDALMANPPDIPAARKALRDCMREHAPAPFADPMPPGPGVRPPLVIPEPSTESPDLRIPLAPDHPNAQN